MKTTIFPILALLLPGTLCAQAATATSPRAAQAQGYYTAHYAKGGSFKVLRYKESGTVTSQTQAGRTTAASASPREDLYSERHYTLRRDAQLVAFRLVSTPRYHFDQSTYRMQDDGTAIVLRVVAEQPPQPAVESTATVPTHPLHTSTGVKAYPNPVETPGIITLEVREGETSTFRLLDPNGRVVHTRQMEGSTYSVSLDDLAPGVYVYTVEGSSYRHSGRLVVQ